MLSQLSEHRRIVKHISSVKERKINSKPIEIFQILLISNSVTQSQAPTCKTGIRHQEFLISNLLSAISGLCNPKCVFKLPYSYLSYHKFSANRVILK